MANYRPIALLLSLSKGVGEQVIVNRLLAHFKNNITVPEQFGFPSNSSTEKADFDLIYEILETLNKKTVGGGVDSSIWKKHLIALIMTFS